VFNGKNEKVIIFIQNFIDQFLNKKFDSIGLQVESFLTFFDNLILSGGR